MPDSLGTTSLPPDLSVNVMLVTVVLTCRLIIVVGLHAWFDEERIATASNVPVIVLPSGSWQPLNTMVTPLRTGWVSPVPQPGSPVLGVTVTWLGQSCS